MLTIEQAREFGAKGGRAGSRAAKRWWALLWWAVRKGKPVEVNLMVLADREREFKRKDGTIQRVREIEAVDWSPLGPMATPLRVALGGCSAPVGTLVRSEVRVRLTAYRATGFGVEFEGQVVEAQGKARL